MGIWVCKYVAAEIELNWRGNCKGHLRLGLERVGVSYSRWRDTDDKEGDVALLSPPCTLSEKGKGGLPPIRTKTRRG